MAKIVLMLLSFIILLGIVGQLDYSEEVNQSSHYCQMVNSGAWPDYKKTGC